MIKTKYLHLKLTEVHYFYNILSAKLCYPQKVLPDMIILLVYHFISVGRHFLFS